MKTISNGAVLAALFAVVPMANAQGGGSLRELAHAESAQAGPGQRARGQVVTEGREGYRATATRTGGLGVAGAKFDEPRHGCAPGRTVAFRIGRAACPFVPARRD